MNLKLGGDINVSSSRNISRESNLDRSLWNGLDNCSYYRYNACTQSKETMTLLSEIPFMETILAAEEKHGIDIHMVIEAMPKTEESPENMDEAEDIDVIWKVEFQEIVKFFENFDDVRNFLLNEAVAKRDDLVIKLNSNSNGV